MTMTDQPRPLRVLVAEDEEFQRAYIVGLLRAHGVDTVHEATHGVDVLNRLNDLGPGGLDLLLCDLELPGLDGFDLLNHVRSSGDPDLQRLPVIIVSVHRHVDTVERATALGATAFIAKPITPAAIQNCLGGLLADPVTGIGQT